MSETKSLRVYGANIFVNGDQVRAIVAAKSQRAAAELLRVSISYLRTYGSETGNEQEIQIANAKPGMVFYQNRRKGGFNAPYQELTAKEAQ